MGGEFFDFVGDKCIGLVVADGLGRSRGGAASCRAGPGVDGWRGGSVVAAAGRCGCLFFRFHFFLAGARV